MEIDKNSIIPLYYQLADLLRDKIATSLLKPGDTIPSENDLIKQYEISRGTVRQALQLLIQEGLLERFPGRGSFVTFPKIQQNAVRQMGFVTQAILESGKVPTARIIESRQFAAPAFLQTKMKLQPNESIFFVKRLRFADGEHLAIENAYLRYDIGQVLIHEDLTGSLYKLLQEKYNIQLYRSENTIEAARADEHTAKILDIAQGDPVLKIDRLVYLQDERPFEYSEDIFRADRIKFSIEDFYQSDKTKIQVMSAHSG
jgi:GntR family transcriptional regulator